jgi:hypothetical protein
MKIKVLFLLVATTLNGTGATIDTARIDQLAGLKGKLNEKEGAYKISFTREATPADSFLKPALPDVSTITADPLNKIFHSSGEVNKGTVKFTFGRPAKIHGVAIDSTMGVNTWAGFAGSDENTVLDGDFAVTENELQKALKSLREAGINIVAIHSHMISEDRGLFSFTIGDAVRLKVSSKVFTKLYQPRLEHSQNLAQV